MKFAICDDTPQELRQIRDYLLQFDPAADWEEFLSAQNLVDAFQSNFFDIVLLDIEMDGLNGYQAAEELNKLPDIPLIIFITQSGDYTIRGYEVAYRYLQKPVQYSDFERALSAAVAKSSPTCLTVMSERGVIILKVRDITYIEVFNYTVAIHTLQNCHDARMTLKELEQELKEIHFARPHNSYLVNLEFVDSVRKNFAVLTDGTQIPISRNRKKQFDEALLRFLRR